MTVFVKEQIVSVLIMCEDRKAKSHKEWLLNKTAQMENLGALEQAWTGEIGKANENLPDVEAFIDQSRWLARCPFCGGVEGTGPEEKIFYCMTCGMGDNNYMALPVVFPEPDTIAKIQAVLLERPVNYPPAPTRYERVVRQTPVIGIDINGQLLGLGRSWQPGQTIEDLHAEQDTAIVEWKAGK